jgi:predicted dehydrogenase
MKRNVLLIGYGSIGKRHARNLIELGIKPYILTKYPDNSNAIFLRDINEIKSENIYYCIISSPTARHLPDFKRCLALPNKPKKILIEKPLECSYSRGNEIKGIAKGYKLNIVVAYNLRFLKIFNIICNFLKEQKGTIRIIEIVAGQDLNEWRPYNDYTQSYSAHREEGGGVDLDLSHEIDYILWLFGNDFKDKIIYRNKISNLKIDSPDIFKLILDYTAFIVDITLDYIRKPRERYIKIICENGKNLYYNFITSTLKLGGETMVMTDNIEQSYKEMLKAFVGIDKKNRNKLCSLEEGLNILKILEV